MRQALILLAIASILTSCGTTGRSYYVSANGNDQDKGTKDHPWKSLNRVNRLDLHPGDTLFLEGGTVFKGVLRLDSMDSGTGVRQVVISSYGTGRAKIQSADSAGIIADHVRWLAIMNLNVEGSGRKQGNTTNGLALIHCTHTNVDSVAVRGFQKSGLLIYSSSYVVANGVSARDNGFAGISVSGDRTKNDCNYISILNSVAENNPGDPTNLTNHSGNGIIAGYCSHVIISYCVATENGWDMPRQGNGPVGIWTYESDSVVIEHCISYRNKTSPGAEDGGGFDLDGGVTNSVIQYCLTYENAGSGFGLFQYDGASAWRNNTVRFNISVDDGLESSAHAGIYVWNGSKDSSRLKDCFFYNNTVINHPGAVLHYHDDSKRNGFHFYNNLFVSEDQGVVGSPGKDEFMGNDWWSTTEKEGLPALDNRFDPQFNQHDSLRLVSPRKLSSFDAFKVPDTSPLRALGVDLRSKPGIDPGPVDFNQTVFPPKGIGASF